MLLILREPQDGDVMRWSLEAGSEIIHSVDTGASEIAPEQLLTGGSVLYNYMHGLHQRAIAVDDFDGVVAVGVFC